MNFLLSNLASIMDQRLDIRTAFLGDSTHPPGEGVLPDLLDRDRVPVTPDF
jgi:hypothetical protein